MAKKTEYPYKPISCSFYDRLELWAMHNDRVVVFYSWLGRIQMVTGKIKDIYTRSKAEYLLMEDDTEIRLDKIISVNGIDLPTAC